MEEDQRKRRKNNVAMWKYRRSWNNRFFRENPPFVSVQIGSDYYEHGGENIGVQEIYFYPTYDPKTLNNNLAIIRLSRRINFHKKSRRVRKIDIDRNPSKWKPNKRFDLVTVIGWGARDRDAGGPAVVNGILLGVISFGSPICGSPDSPTVFTKLGFYGDWIDEILEKEVPYTYKRTTIQLVPRPFTVIEKFTTAKKIMTPLVTTPELTVIDNVEALRILQTDGYDKFSSSSFDSKEPFEKIKRELKEITHQPFNTNKNPEDISRQTVKVTAIIPIIESTKKGETYSELDETEENESNDAPIETVTESAERITVLGNLEEKEDIKNNLNALVHNLNIDKLLNEMENNATKTVISEKYNVSENFFNTINQTSSVNYLSLSNEDEEGLNIPVASFRNPALKLVPRTRDYDEVSESLLFEVVSKAIEEEIKLQVRERKNLKGYSS
ncbi:unnamed protein product [Arctia plantaginis]|uniref:Peptidase S1 domain-containing protein n=1 Tax=Arctia plantaginis TaxID=874455 RepID=A0A8S1AJ79_ARCPL|nr:unnamed protein product [Arctia plantaginis]